MNARLYSGTIAAVLVFTFAVGTLAQENTGQIQQGVVSGQPVATLMQEELGLLTLQTPTSSCSASLLTNEWIITAAHCLKPGDVGNPSQVTLTANWNTVQVRQAVEIRSSRVIPQIPTGDLALIRVANPFRVNGSFQHFRRELLANGLDDLVGYGIETYGRGINRVAQNFSGTAIPSQSDGQFRLAKTQITRVEGMRYWFPRNSSNQIISGGDSGGPSFIITRTGRALAGVHSSCLTRCLPGQTCDPPNPWTWISDIPECADASIAPVYQQLSQIIRDSAASLARNPARPADERGSGKVEGIPGISVNTEGTFDTSAPAPSVVSYIYAVGSDGLLQWRRHDGAEQGLPQWQSFVPLSNGWGNFKHVFTGGKNTIYAVTTEGNLLWFRHNTAYNVRRNRRREVDVIGPRLVGTGWQNFRNVFSAGDGVIYAIDGSGNLLWYKHKQYTDAVEMPQGAGSGMVGQAVRLNWARSWESLMPRTVGVGWSDFAHVFPGGDGIIYVVTRDGALRRYRHVGYLDGRGLESPGAWEGPININTGWSGYQKFFSRGDGIIYAVGANGELFWFKDRVPRNGGRAALGRPWYGPTKVDDAWGSFLNVFALLPISAPDVIR